MFYIKLYNKFLTPIINILFLSFILIINIMFIINPEISIFGNNFKRYYSDRPHSFYFIFGILLNIIIALGLIIIVTNYYKGNLEVLDVAYSRAKGKKIIINIILTYLGIYSILYIITFINAYYQYSRIVIEHTFLDNMISDIFIPYIVIIILSILIAKTFKQLNIAIMIMFFYYIMLEYAMPKFLEIPGHLLDYMISSGGTNSRYSYAIIIMIIIAIYRKLEFRN